MIRINLLPHREEKRKAKRVQFYALGGLVAILGALIILFGWTINEQTLSAQEEQNVFLGGEIEKLNKQIAQIKALKDEIELLKKKKEVIETLQRDRGLTVTLLTELVNQIPEGVYLKSVRQVGKKITLAGFAQSNSRVSELMRNLDQSSAFDKPSLVQTNIVTVNNRRLQEFNMGVDLSPVKLAELAAADTSKQPTAPAPAPKAEEQKK